MKAILLTLLALSSAINVQAALVTKPVTYDDKGTKLVGYLAYDDAVASKGKPPGILVIHEWWGLNDYIKGRAKQLAKMGYVAFAADIFGDGETTADPEKARELSSKFYGKPLMAERAQAGMDQLLKTGLVDEKKIAAIGFCFGGATSLALAYTGAPLAGVVTFHGALLPPPEGAAQKTKAKFLVLHGALDPLVGKDAVDTFLKAMNEGKFDFQFIEYSGAIHAFTNPNADKTGVQGVGYNAEAASRSWSQMQLFFDEIFGSVISG
jgi:dienelactone hydrolase